MPGQAPPIFFGRRAGLFGLALEGDYRRLELAIVPVLSRISGVAVEKATLHIRPALLARGQ